jgi:Mrp family chromosome partitioning ATPase
MSRMYSVWTGGAHGSASRSGANVGGCPEPLAPSVPRVLAPQADPAIEPAPDVSDPDFVPEADDTPFVEVGGPGGTVFSAGVATSTGSAVPVDRAAVKPATRTYPRLANTPLYLSVTFHDLTGLARPQAAVDGPDPGLVAMHLPDHPVSGEYRVLRDEIRNQLPDPTPRVLLFTAASPESGTTSVLLNLAVTLARENTPRVLVLDANLPPDDEQNVTRQGVAQKLALPAGPGLAEVLAQQVPLAWAVRATPVANLQVLATGTLATRVTSVIGEDLPKLIDQLRQWYDWVLIDGGVWGAMPERDAVCPAADAVYLVTRSADVDRSEFAGVRGWVKQLGGLLRGYITTRV